MHARNFTTNVPKILDLKSSSEQIFSRKLSLGAPELVKTKSSYKMVSKDKPISYSTFRDHLSKSLRSIVPDPSVYGTHSFRSGGASMAANSGVGDRVYQRHGRWKSVSAKDGYVKDDIASRISVSKSLGF